MCFGFSIDCLNENNCKRFFWKSTHMFESSMTSVQLFASAVSVVIKPFRDFLD